jgi:sulfur carrier protein
MNNISNEITVNINGELFKFQGNVTILDILDKLNLANSKGIAVAVNMQIVSSKDWKEYIVSNNDKIIIIQATQGG